MCICQGHHLHLNFSSIHYNKQKNILKMNVSNNNITRFVLGLIILISLTGYKTPEVTYPEHLTQLHQNLIDYYLETPIDSKKVQQLLETMDEKGSWSKINYKDNFRGGWTVKEHLENVQKLAIAYKKVGSDFYNNKDLAKKLHRSLNYWLKNDFLSPNWWDQHIGVPELLAPTLFLIENELTKEQLELALPLLRRAEIKMTGQNKVWLSGNVLFRSLLLRDADSIAMASKSIQEELVVSKAEGIQSDWSYHQHGAQLQFGNYGLSYLEDMLRWYQILSKTPFAFEGNKTAILRNYILEGQQWINWKNQFDVSVCGRQIFPDEPARKAKRLDKLLQIMAEVDAENAEKYKQAADYKTLAGDKHFWRSDFHVHRTNDYYFSVKMCSNRVLGAETVNLENIQGYHLGDGVTMLYQSNKEYDNIFPYWDWKKLPGTTIIQHKDTLPYLTAWGYHIESDFVGGVSDSVNGISVLDYNRDGLKAHKSWFMFNDKIVCLGSGINATTEFPVATTLNQVFLRGEVLVSINGKAESGRGLKPTDRPDWILHDNTGYFFPKSGSLRMENKMLEGSWNKVAKRYRPIIVTDEIFKLWFDHGPNPTNASYEYVLVPKADKEKMNKLKEQSDLKILNTVDIQSVELTDKSMAGIIFYKAGKSDIFGGIEVDKPCVVMIKVKDGVLKISVADPTHKLNEINIMLNGQYRAEQASVEDNKTKLKISLPQDGYAGKSISITLNKDR